MGTVSALYRYPVKGFTPEDRDELLIQPDGRVAGDRVLAVRFADATSPEIVDGHEYWPKKRGLALMDFPSLATLRLSYDESAGRLRIAEGARLLVEATLDERGRREIADALAAHVLAGPDARRLRRAGRLPLQLVGDGVTSRFQDRARGYVSVHTAASVAAVDAVSEAPVDDRRFRSNIAVEGFPAWSELGWRGRVRIGDVVFDVQRPIVRCAAILANPDTGLQDAPLLRLLAGEFDQQEPTLGMLLLPADGGGVIRVGDEVAPV